MKIFTSLRRILVVYLGVVASLIAQPEVLMSDYSREQKSDLLKSVLQGRSDFFQSGAVASSLPGAEYQDTGAYSLYALGTDYACHNGIIEKDPYRVPDGKEIERMIQHFAAHKLPFMWWTSASVLETKGFQFGGNLIGIALDIRRGFPPRPPASPSLSIDIVESESDVRIFTELAASAFALSPLATEQWIPLNFSAMKGGEQIHFLARLNGVPVGTATLSSSPSSAGIWNLATVPEYRKSGVGAALAYAALLEAKKRQYGQVMAILMPKGLAWGLFKKLGFQEVCEFPFYVYGVSAEELEK